MEVGQVRFYEFMGKRLLDILLSLGLLILSLPIILLVILILFLQNKGDVFYFQQRPGYLEKSFYIVKFKTMSDAVDTNGKLLPDIERITFFGNIIRKLSLDELPQLYNVLIGDMSLVGPRPLLFKYLSLYTVEQRRRHLVKPGITGLAQINGRNNISWGEKFEYDIKYIRNQSFILDVKIIVLTILKIVMRDGVNQNADRTMEPFNGSN